MNLQEVTARCRDFKHVTLALAICLAALLVRLGALLMAHDFPLDDGAVFHLSGAHMLSSGEGFSDPSFPVSVAPLYTVFLAVFSSVSGNEQLVAKIAQAFVDSTTTFIIYLIACEVFGVKTALLSACIWAVYPFAIYVNLYIGSETLFTFLLSGFVLLALYANRFTGWKWYGSAGIVLGLATLTRGTTQFLPFVFLPLVIGALRRQPNLFPGYASFLLAFVLVLAPWGLRNFVVLHEFIPTTTTGSMVLLWGSSEEFFTIEERVRSLPDYFALLHKRGVRGISGLPSPSLNSDMMRMAAIEKYRIRFQEDPVSVVPFLLKKFARLWYATESGKNHLATVGLNAPIYLLALFGLVVASVLKKRSALLLAGVVGYFVAIHVITLPLFRYMVPVMPYVIVFASFALVYLLDGFHANRAALTRHSQPD